MRLVIELPFVNIAKHIEWCLLDFKSHLVLWWQMKTNASKAGQSMTTFIPITNWSILGADLTVRARLHTYSPFCVLYQPRCMLHFWCKLVDTCANLTVRARQHTYCPFCAWYLPRCMLSSNLVCFSFSVYCATTSNQMGKQNNTPIVIDIQHYNTTIITKATATTSTVTSCHDSGLFQLRHFAD